ncbi:MAG: S1C family serine protease [Patescibacteria group bacterium]
MSDRREHFVRPTTDRPPSLFNLSLLAIFFGLVAGLGGYLLGRTFLPTQFNFFNNQPDLKINLEQPLVNLADNNQKSIAGIYRSSKVIAGVGEPLYTNNDFLGSAVVVTSDGWLMTTNQVIDGSKEVVLLAGESYDVKATRVDKFSGAVFIKIEASGLQPVNFPLADGLKPGERVYTNLDIPNSLGHSFQSALVASTHYTLTPYLSTDNVDYYLQISGSNTRILAAPYFNVKGDMIGMGYQLNQETLLLPSEYLRQAVKHLLNNTSRTTWGIAYVDLENNTGFEEKGNMIYGPNGKPLTANSLAAKAGLKAGDRLIAVNNDVISKDRTITSILQNYRSGDKIILKINRQGTEQDLEIKP